MTKKITLTHFQKNLLVSIFIYPGITAADLAREFWPNSLAHRRSYRQGNGSCHGKGAWLAMGGQVGKLRKMGLVRHGYVNRDGDHVWQGYSITPAAKKFL